MNDALLDEVSDPSDWTGAWSELRPLDTSLRCGLCSVRDVLVADRRTFFAPPWRFENVHICFALLASESTSTNLVEPGLFAQTVARKKAFDAELVAQPALEAAANHWRHARYVGRIFFFCLTESWFLTRLDHF